MCGGGYNFRNRGTVSVSPHDKNEIIGEEQVAVVYGDEKFEHIENVSGRFV